MEMKQLEFLVTCARTQSFSMASKLLYTAQSNVSKVIRSLEEELGVELFERRQSGIVLTEKGKQIYEYACNTLDSVQKIRDCSMQKERRELSFSCNPSSWMASAFCEYYRRCGNDDTKYSVMMASTAEIIRRLASGIDQIGFIYMMEDQLPIMEGRFEKNHLYFAVLKRTKMILYFGAKNSLDVETSMLPEQLLQKENLQERPLWEEVSLVQGYEDELFFRARGREDKEKSIGNLAAYQVAVTTNSDYVMEELLQTTRLCNISGDSLTCQKSDQEFKNISLTGEEKPVLFGCLLRNDRDLEKEPVDYLNYVKGKLQGRQ